MDDSEDDMRNQFATALARLTPRNLSLAAQIGRLLIAQGRASKSACDPLPTTARKNESQTEGHPADR